MSVSKPKTQVFTGGDKRKAQALRPAAFEELRLLREQMRLRGLKQYQSTSHLDDGSFIQCRSVFDNDQITIFGAPTPAPEEKRTITRRPFDLLFLFDPIVCLDGSSDPVPCGDSEEKYSRREYQILKVSDWEEPVGRDLRTIEQAIDPVTNAVCTTGRQTSIHGTTNCQWHGSKTVENVTVHAFSYLLWITNLWILALDVNGRAADFPVTGNHTFGPFSDNAVNGDDGNESRTVRAFDVWKTDDGDICISACGDLEETLHVWNITQDTYDSYPLGIRDYYLNEYSPHHYSGDGIEDRHIRLVGLCKTTAYYAECAFYYSKMTEFHEVFKIDGLTGAVTPLGISGVLVVFDPFAEEIVYWSNNIESSAAEPTFGAWTLYSEQSGGDPNPLCLELHPWGHYEPCGAFCTGQAPPTWGGSIPYTRCVEAGGVENCQVIQALTSPNMCECAREIRFTTDYFNDIGTGGMHASSSLFGGSMNTDHIVLRAGIRLSAWCDDDEAEVLSSWGDGQGSCTVWNNWPQAYAVDAVSITGSGVGVKYGVTRRNGKTCSGSGADYEDTDDEDILGAFNEDYGVASWPHFKNFALCKEAEDREGNVHSDLLALQDNDGIVHVDSNQFQNTQFLLRTSQVGGNHRCLNRISFGGITFAVSTARSKPTSRET